MSRYMKSTTAQRVQVALGRKVPSAKPVVMPFSTAQATCPIG